MRVTVLDVTPFFSLSLLMVVVIFASFLSDIKNNIFFIAFIVSFVVFLMGSDIVQIFFGGVSNIETSDAANTHSYFCIMLSLFFLYLGYRFGRRKRDSKCEKIVEEKYSLRESARIIFYISYPLMMASIIDNAIYVIRNGYFSYYLDYTSNVPLIIDRLGDLAPIALCIFLATFPSKKECRWPVRLYLLYSLACVATGKRFITIAAVLLILIYYIIRNKENENEIWLPRWMVILCVVSIPFICVGMFLITYIRNGSTIVLSSFSEMLLEFFERIGASNKVIKWEYDYASELPDNKIYSFGSVLDYLKGNYFAQLLFPDTFVTAGHTVEYAKNGDLLSYALTYVVVPNRYLNGYGLGSCYIAELYHDFGYAGVCIGNLVLGIVIKKWMFLSKNHVLRSAVVLFLTFSLLRTPRDNYSMMLADLINIKNWAFFACIFFVGNTIRNLDIRSRVNE